MSDLEEIMKNLDKELETKYGPVGEAAKKKKKKDLLKEGAKAVGGRGMNQNQRRLLEKIEKEGY